MVLLLVGLLAPAHADDTVFPDGSGDLVSVADLERRGVILGRTGRLLVGSTAADALSALPDVARVDRLPGGALRVTPAPGVDDLALSRALHARADVAWAHPDFLLPLSVSDLPDDPLRADEWHLENTGQGGRTPGVDVDAEDAWQRATGAGVTIAVIDSGVQTDHPDLSVIAGHDYLDRDDDPNPDGSSEGPHGTCAAGVAAGSGGNGYGVAGVAWNADVYAIRLIGGATSMDDLYGSFAEAVDAGAGVLSNSWGFTSNCTESIRFGSFTQMFGYAEQDGRGGLGSVVVFASGNSGCDIALDGMLEHDTLIVVAALESNDVRAGYSNYGEWLDLAAPTGLLTTDMVGGGYGSYNGDDAFVDGFGGTSAATPVVSGVAALMIEANPRATAEQIREVLCETAVRVDVANAGYDAAGWSPYYGCGRVDAGGAVAAIANGEPAAPVPTLTAGHVWEGRAILAWDEAVDPDGDVLDYEVSWWREGDEATQVTIDGLSLDLGPELAVGDRVTWQVRARDPWGQGPWSAAVTFVVEATETESTATVEPSCGVTGGGGWLGLALAAVGMVRRRLTPAPVRQTASTRSPAAR